MQNWEAKLLEVFVSIDTASELDVLAKIKLAAEALGFQHVTYTVGLRLPVTKQKVVSVATFPTPTKSRYDRSQTTSSDPGAREPFMPSPTLPIRQAVCDSDLYAWGEPSENKARISWTRSVQDAWGLKGTLTLLQFNGDLTNEELEIKQKQLEWLLTVAHLALSQVIALQFRRENCPDLTAREIEILKWTADGKSSDEIASILNLSADTINYHIKKSIIKLKMSNKTSAVVRAALLGLFN